ncbi:MAG: hypothetical protein QOD63_850 [Actinomycetota bacterium]|jgi:hypothetical protein|nr:hypothetical protein [Actinomycetota bacterium]
MADDERPITEAEVKEAVGSALAAAGVHPAYLHAIQVTGFILTVENAHLFDADDIEEWNAAVAAGEALYGPAD